MKWARVLEGRPLLFEVPQAGSGAHGMNAFRTRPSARSPSASCRRRNRRAGSEGELAAIEWAGDAHVPPATRPPPALSVPVRTRGSEDLLWLLISLRRPTIFSALAPAWQRRVALGASNIRIWPGTRQRDSRVYSPEERRTVANVIRDMAAEAARHGVTVSLEYHPQTLTDETGSALSLIEAVAHPNVYLYWQPRPGLPLDEALVEIARIGEHISHLHVFAWDGDRNRLPLASAADYWRAVLAAIPSSRWTGRRFAMLEFVAGDDPGAFLADAATLRKILEAEFPPGASAFAGGD